MQDELQTSFQSSIDKWSLINCLPFIGLVQRVQFGVEQKYEKFNHAHCLTFVYYTNKFYMQRGNKTEEMLEVQVFRLYLTTQDGVLKILNNCKFFFFQ